MELLDKDLLNDANETQRKIEESGISLISVETEDKNVVAAIERVFGIKTNIIDFNMFASAVRNLRRVGMIHGYSNI